MARENPFLRMNRLTDITVDPSRNIYTFSDIHGDIDVLLVCLRDCARVIRLRQDRTHEQVKQLLEQDLTSDIPYQQDLGYEWCGGDSKVVICGDYIDPVRPGRITTKPVINEDGSANVVEEWTGKIQHTDIPTLYYPQVEVKILFFLNAIHEQSERYGGTIYKVLGNHEFMNFEGVSEDYHFPQDKQLINYCNVDENGDRTISFTRNEYFRYGNPGYRLFQRHNMYVVLKINNNIFVHGQLPDATFIGIDKPKLGVNFKSSDSTIYNYHEINKALNSDYEEEMENGFYPYDYIEGMKRIIEQVTWPRNWGFFDVHGENYSSRTDAMIKHRAREHNDEDFCNNIVQAEIDRFLNDGIKDHQVRVFIGHCQQTNALDSFPTQAFETFTHYMAGESDETREVYDNLSSVRGTADPYDLDNNRTFGITTECHIKGLPNFQPQIIKLDVAAGRGQDDPVALSELFTVVTDERKNRYAIDQVNHHPTVLSARSYFLPRVPQVVCIQGNNLRLIRSTFQNMMRRVDRYYPLYRHTFTNERGELRRDTRIRIPLLGRKRSKNRYKQYSKRKSKRSYKH